jgi:hypothetical protein
MLCKAWIEEVVLEVLFFLLTQFTVSSGYPCDASGDENLAV